MQFLNVGCLIVRVLLLLLGMAAGCNDTAAANYLPPAASQDGRPCVYGQPTLFCSDSSASNFNSAASGECVPGWERTVLVGLVVGCVLRWVGLRSDQHVPSPMTHGSWMRICGWAATRCMCALGRLLVQGPPPLNTSHWWQASGLPPRHGCAGTLRGTGARTPLRPTMCLMPHLTLPGCANMEDAMTPLLQTLCLRCMHTMHQPRKRPLAANSFPSLRAISSPTPGLDCHCLSPWP